MQCRKFLDPANSQVQRKFHVYLILDNYGIPKTPLIRNWLAKCPRSHVHFKTNGCLVDPSSNVG